MTQETITRFDGLKTVQETDSELAAIILRGFDRLEKEFFAPAHPVDLKRWISDSTEEMVKTQNWGALTLLTETLTDFLVALKLLSVFNNDAKIAAETNVLMLAIPGEEN